MSIASPLLLKLPMKNEFEPKQFILVFKTNIRCRNDIYFLTPFLNSGPGILRWSVDLTDVDNVLRIESAHADHKQVIEIVKNAGYSCEELTD
jgi:hypothetical protein